MTYTKIHKMIKRMGLPATYHHWQPGHVPPLPYLVYLVDEQRYFAADNVVYQKIASVRLELYSDRKNFAAEEQIERIFEEDEIVYDKYEEYIESEKLFEQVYEFEVMLEVAENERQGKS